MRKKILWGSLIVVGVALVAAAFLLSDESALNVKLSTVEEGRITEKIFASGKLEAVHSYTQFADTNGIVSKVLVKQGDRVKDGQPLLTFNTAEIESQIREAENSLKVMELERAKSLKDQEEARKKQFDEFKKQQFEERGEVESAAAPVISNPNVTLDDARISNQQSKLEELKHKQEQLKLTVKGDGTVTEVSLEEGQFLSQGSKVAVVTDTEKLRVRAQAGELDAAKIKPDMAVIISGDAFGQTYTGKVEYISPIAVISNSASREASVELLVSVDQAGSGELKPGYNVILEFRHQGEPALLLPLGSVLYEGGKSYVFKSIDGKSVKAEVKTGKEGDENVEILEGLNAGEQVIAEIPLGLKEGRKVVEK